MTDAVSVVQEFYDVLRAGDVTRAVALLSPDLEWTEAEGFPYYSGTWRGPQAVVDKLLIPLAKDWVVFSVRPHEFIAADERAVSFSTYAGTSGLQVAACPRPSRIGGLCAMGKSFASTFTRTP